MERFIEVDGDSIVFPESSGLHDDLATCSTVNELLLKLGFNDESPEFQAKVISGYFELATELEGVDKIELHPLMSYAIDRWEHRHLLELPDWVEAQTPIE